MTNDTPTGADGLTPEQRHRLRSTFERNAATASAGTAADMMARLTAGRSGGSPRARMLAPVGIAAAVALLAGGAVVLTAANDPSPAPPAVVAPSGVTDPSVTTAAETTESAAAPTGPTSSAPASVSTVNPIPSLVDLTGLSAEDLATTAGTLTYYLSPPYAEGEEARNRRLAVERDTEECMATAGVPYGTPELGTSTSPEWDEFYADRGGRDWTLKWGYGISVHPEYPETVMERPPTGLGSLTPVDTESDADRAYRVAWDGPLRAELDDLRAVTVPEGEPPETDSEYLARESRTTELIDAVSVLETATEILPGAGCGDVATVATNLQYPPVAATPEDPDPAGPTLLEEFASLLGAANGIRPAVLADPEVVAPLQTWVTCMAAGGYPDYTDPRAPADDILQRYGKIQGWNMSGPTYDYGGTFSFGSAVDPRVEPPQELTELQADERALAPVDFDCSVPLTPIIDRVTLRYEQEFVVEHQAELESFRAAFIQDW